MPKKKQTTRKHPRIIKLFAIILLIALMVASTAYVLTWSWQRSKQDKPLHLGVSFSVKYANELGIDWQASYRALLDDLDIEYLRLMSYWDSVEPEPGVYNFDDLDWQMNEAALRSAKVTLAVGQRQPRWPECHVPGWAAELESEAYKQAVLDYIGRVVVRYKDHPALHSWQLENEYANRLFGECTVFDNTFLDEEYEAIKAIDSEHDVIINVSNQSGFPIKGTVAERTGFSVYRRAHFEAFGEQRAWSYGYIPSWWHGLRAMIIEDLHGGEDRTFIHELQTEPWGPKPTVQLSIEEQSKTMDIPKIRESLDFGIATGMREIYLWGGEWWYWRLTEFNDTELWDAMREIYKMSE